MEATDNAATGEPETTTMGKIGCLVGIVLLTLLLNGCAWFLSGKAQVIVLDDMGGNLHVGQEYFTTGEDYLLGLPAAMMRPVGMEPPSSISGSGGTVNVGALTGAESLQDIILVNPTARDIWYTAIVYGDDSSLSRGAKTGTTKVPAGSGVVVVGKTHGDWKFGCENEPSDEESFSIGIADSKDYAVLGWITEQDPETCGTAK